MKRTPPDVSSDDMVNFELKGVEQTKELFLAQKLLIMPYFNSSHLFHRYN